MIRIDRKKSSKRKSYGTPFVNYVKLMYKSTTAHAHLYLVLNNQVTNLTINIYNIIYTRYNYMQWIFRHGWRILKNCLDFFVNMKKTA